MGSKPKAPKPLDVEKVSSEQAKQNEINIGQQAAYNRPNQTNQYGSTLRYVQNGTDANGNPIFTQATSLGPQGTQFAGGFANLGQQYISGAGDFLANRPEMGGNAAFDRAYNYASANLEPRYDRAMEALDNKLKNQGFSEGDEAYKNAISDLRLSQDAARNDLTTKLQGQIFDQGLKDRIQQQSEFGLLTPGVNYAGQTVTGGFNPVPGISVPNVDLTSLYGQSKAQEWQNYQAAMNQYNGMLGGLAGLGGSILTAPLTGGGSLIGGLFR